MFSPTLGNVRSCNHTAAVKNLFQSWRKVWKPFLTGTMSRSLATSFSFKVGCKLRSMNFPRVTWEVSGDKKGLQWIHAFVCIVEFAFPFSCYNFCDLYFMIPFTCFPFCVFRRSEYMSARRIAYAWFVYVPLFLAYCVSTFRFLLSSLSQTLLCSSTVHWPQE